MDGIRRYLCLSAFALVSGLGTLVSAQVPWIDVRSEAEHLEDRIEGDINIPHESIADEVARRFPDKATQLHLYCGTGRRAGLAAEALAAAGYTNITNAGSIDDARKARGLNP